MSILMLDEGPGNDKLNRDCVCCSLRIYHDHFSVSKVKSGAWKYGGHVICFLLGSGVGCGGYCLGGVLGLAAVPDFDILEEVRVQRQIWVYLL